MEEENDHTKSISADAAVSADEYEQRLMHEAMVQFQEFIRLGCTPIAAATGIAMRGTIPQLAPLVTGLVADGWSAKRIRKALLPRLAQCIDEAVGEALRARENEPEISDAEIRSVFHAKGSAKP